MKQGFFKCDKGNSSSKRLMAIPCAFAGILLLLAQLVVSIENESLLITSSIVLFSVSLIFSGMATLKDFGAIIKTIKGNVR
jgi:hypothetical protein